jgi:ankyrin repeat protein
MKTKDKKGMIPLAYACKYGHTEVLKVFLEFKARINAGIGLNRMPPLHFAAAYGHYDMCEFILDNKGRVLGKDKFKRTPLIMACRNGFAKIASLLL